MIFLVFAAIFPPFLLSLAGVAAMRATARRIGFIDRPGGHKQHQNPVALGGGIVITWVIAGTILGGVYLAKAFRDDIPQWLPEFFRPHLDGIIAKANGAIGIIGGMIVLHVLGFIDDRRPLGPAVKFIVEFIVALAIAGPLQIRIAEFLSPSISIAVTAIWIVLITNAFNFLDNMDGLSAGVAIIACAIFGVTSLLAGQIFVPAMSFVVVGVLLGYLFFNFPPASIFMGDAGSLVVGYLLSVLTILTTYYDPQRGLTPVGLLAPLVILAVPLYDVISVVMHRVRQGENPLRGDRRHFSHRLVRRGLSERGAVLTIYLATAATGLPAILLPYLEWPMAILVCGQCICVTVMIAALEHAGPSPIPPKE